MKDIIKFEALYSPVYYSETKALSFVCEDSFPSDMTDEQVLFCVNEGTRCADWCMEKPQFKTSHDAIVLWEHFSEQEALTEGCMCGHIDFKIIERIRQ